jgi:hypothetical protein
VTKFELGKCFTNVTFPNKEDDRYKEFLIWLGEFAVGYLNNKLASQLPASNSGHRCSSIRANNEGNTIRNVVERRSSRGVYLFDILTKHDDSIDVFNFQILFNDKRNETLESSIGCVYPYTVDMHRAKTKTYLMKSVFVQTINVNKSTKIIYLITDNLKLLQTL